MMSFISSAWIVRRFTDDFYGDLMRFESWVTIQTLGSELVRFLLEIFVVSRDFCYESLLVFSVSISYSL